MAQAARTGKAYSPHFVLLQACVSNSSIWFLVPQEGQSQWVG
jgi:hypothetical protein